MVKSSVPPPVLVTERDLPRVLLVVAVGVTLAVLLAMQLDAWVAGEANGTSFHYPYVFSCFMTIFLH